MPAAQDVKDIERFYNMANERFIEWRKGLNKTAQKELAEDLGAIQNNLKKFGVLIKDWHDGEIHNQIDKAALVKYLDKQLNLIVTDHTHLVEKAQTIKNPTVIQSIKSYLSMIIEPLQKLCRAVADLAHAVSSKTKNTIATSFDSFKQSVQSIGKKGGEAKPSAAYKPNPNDMV